MSDHKLAERLLAQALAHRTNAEPDCAALLEEAAEALAAHEQQQAGEAVALKPLSDEYKPDALRWREAKRFRVGDESGGVGIWYEKQRVWVTGDLADSLADGQIAQRFFDEHGCWPCHASDEQLAGTDAEHLQPPYGRDRGITKDTTE